jgi:hypothetical protein
MSKQRIKIESGLVFANKSTPTMPLFTVSGIENGKIVGTEHTVRGNSQHWWGYADSEGYYEIDDKFHVVLSYPNKHQEKTMTTNPASTQIKVGQVWSNGPSEHTITQIKDGWFGIRNQLGDENSKWGRVSEDPKSWYAGPWRLMKGAPEDTQRNDDASLLKKLEAIYNGCNNKTFRELGGNWSEITKLGYFEHGDFPDARTRAHRLTTDGYAKMVELQKAKASKECPKVGQIWIGFADHKYRVKSVERADFPRIELEIQSHDGTWKPDYARRWKEGKFQSDRPDWELVEDPEIDRKPIIGSVWIDRYGNRYKITSYRSKNKEHSFYVELSKDIEGRWEHGYCFDWENGAFLPDDRVEWKLESLTDLTANSTQVKGQDTSIPSHQIKAAVGQVWKLGNDEATITAIKGKNISVKYNDGRIMEIWGCTNADGTIGGIDRWKLEKAVPVPGQVWKTGSHTYRVVKYDPSKSSRNTDLEYLNSAGVWVPGASWHWKDGKFEPLYGDEWTLEQKEGIQKHHPYEGVRVAKEDPNIDSTKQEEVMKQPEIKVGQIWTVGDGGSKYRLKSIDIQNKLVQLEVWDRSTEEWTQSGSWIICDPYPFGSRITLVTDVEPEKPAIEKLTFRQMMGQDMTNASYRVAANQLTKGTKKAILSLMEKQGQRQGHIRALSDLLDTEAGSAMVGMLLGMGLTYLPQVSNSPRAQRLAQEFRVGSMSKAGNAAMNIMTEHFIPVITSALSGLPEERVRIAEASVQSMDDPSETSQEERKELCV